MKRKKKKKKKEKNNDVIGDDTGWIKEAKKLLAAFSEIGGREKKETDNVGKNEKHNKGKKREKEEEKILLNRIKSLFI